MTQLRRSPFKVDRIERDPSAFGRRVEDIKACASALFNGRHVLITGPRGIGKSSLGSQLQTVYDGETTLLERCGVDSRLPHFLTAFYACDSTTTLAELCSEILYALERKYWELKRHTTSNTKVSIELDLKVIKAKLETDISTRRPATLATDLVAGLRTIRASANALGFDGINIMIDELDLLPESVNFGHFLKIVHETLGRDGLQDVTLILAGQRGTYSRLLAEDASAERLVRHVPLSVLEPDEARYVLEYAADHAQQPFSVSPRASEMILALASGYPYDLHLVGDAAFSVMETPEMLRRDDVLRGLADLFRSDKREKYIERLRALSDNQRLVLVSIARFSGNRIPMRIALKWVDSNLLGKLSENAKVDAITKELVGEGLLVVNEADQWCQFTEELFRVFVSLFLIDQREIQERRRLKDEIRSAKVARSRRLAAEKGFVQYYLDEEKVDEEKIDFAIDVLRDSDFEAEWEREDDSGLAPFGS